MTTTVNPSRIVFTKSRETLVGDQATLVVVRHNGPEWEWQVSLDGELQDSRVVSDYQFAIREGSALLDSLLA